MKTFRFLLYISAISLMSCPAGCQTGSEVGSLCPDFTLIGHNPDQEFNIRSARGKWIILEFWSRNCLTCIKSFPKLDSLQQAFQGKIKFVLVAPGGKEAQAHIGLFRKIRDRYNLKLNTFYDSMIFNQFGVKNVPHIVVIDPSGIIHAKPPIMELKQNNLEQMIEGRSVLPTPYEVTKASFRHESLLTIWDKTHDPIRIVAKLHRNEKACYSTNGISLKRLFNLAWFGKAIWGPGDSLYAHVWPEPIIADSATATRLEQAQKHHYNYKLCIPENPANRKDLQWALQCDLLKFFRMSAMLESREMPCWKLVVSDQKKIYYATTQQYQRTISHTELTLVNTPVSELLKVIAGKHDQQPPFLDQTGINKNIVIKLETMLTEFDDLREALQQNGLDLIRSTHPMQVLLISSPQSPEQTN